MIESNDYLFKHPTNKEMYEKMWDMFVDTLILATIQVKHHAGYIKGVFNTGIYDAITGISVNMTHWEGKNKQDGKQIYCEKYNNHLYPIEYNYDYLTPDNLETYKQKYLKQKGVV